MTPLLYLLGVVVFVLAILASIGLHELGHMIPAKAFGGKVTQYFIGFGPTIWSRQKGETEYGVKAIPVGGYVKIVGMLPPDKEHQAKVEYDEEGNRVVTVRRSNTGLFAQLISDARAAEWETITAEDEHRLFYRMPWWKKVVVMAGGPTVNLMIAFVIFAGLFATYGNPADEVLHPTVSKVEACVVPAAQDGRVCRPSDPVSPARQAGLQVGDRFVSFNGTPVHDWGDMQDLIRNNENGAATIVVERDGHQVTLHANTMVTPRPTDVNDPTKLTPVGFLGVSPTVTYTTGGPIYTIQQMGGLAKQSAQALATLPVKVWGVAEAIAGVKPRAADSPVSVVGGGRLAGETASAQDFPLKDKLVSVLGLVAGFNFFIGLFNFIPLLPLDGGHIAGALWEQARRVWARIRRRPDPGYVDVAKLLPVAYVVASFLLVMGVVLIVGDLVVPVQVS
ncbi:MAG TPA: site-2 protease family protein [Nocardioides sp.]|jgi:membrane-associated protease RseP (regulator of RpoE activity)|nr:site-2 protease family protein [Nocardioides sp.]